MPQTTEVGGCESRFDTETVTRSRWRREPECRHCQRVLRGQAAVRRHGCLQCRGAVTVSAPRRAAAERNFRLCRPAEPTRLRPRDRGGAGDKQHPRRLPLPPNLRLSPRPKLSPKVPRKLPPLLSPMLQPTLHSELSKCEGFAVKSSSSWSALSLSRLRRLGPAGAEAGPMVKISQTQMPINHGRLPSHHRDGHLEPRTWMPWTRHTLARHCQ